MRGFLVGSLALVVLRALVQDGSSKRVEQGSNWLTDGVRRVLSGNVAGVPKRGAGKRAAAAAGAVGGAVKPATAGSVVGAATPRLVQGGL